MFFFWSLRFIGIYFLVGKTSVENLPLRHLEKFSLYN